MGSGGGGNDVLKYILEMRSFIHTYIREGDKSGRQCDDVVHRQLEAKRIIFLNLLECNFFFINLIQYHSLNPIDKYIGKKNYD